MIDDIPYRNPLVRDLAWALSSPPLLQRKDTGVRWLDDNWFYDIVRQYRSTLEQLEKKPHKLAESIHQAKDRRLGNYFETLWRFWLNTNNRYRLLHANLPVRNSERTLGEFDFLVEDGETGKVLHWETAVKFYLGVADTTQPVNWWGPAQHDRLDIKTRRLLEHQGRLSRYPESRDLLRTLDIEIDETWLILKGRLFYPVQGSTHAPHGSSLNHLRGFWINATSMSRLRESRWLPLERHQWLAPVTAIEPADCLSNRMLNENWQRRDPAYPLCVARIEDGTETERGFIVADNWLEKIPSTTGF